MKTRAVRFHATGGPEVLRIDEVELDQPGRGELRLRIEAIGLNRAEAAFRAGQYLEAPQLPARLGYEASGVIEAVGQEVHGWAVGDAVCVLPAFSMNDYGVYAEHAIVPAHALIRRPPGLAATAAAALWMAYLTAYGALIDIAGVGQGDAVLITAASSSVALAAIQIANARGAIPIALTRSAAKAEHLLRLGAAQVIAGAGDDLASRVMEITGGKGARLAFDPVAGPAIMPLAEALAAGGMLILYGNLSGRAAETPFPFFPAVGKGLSLRGYLVFELIRDPARLAAAGDFIAAGLAAGSLNPVIDRVFAFDDIAAAHRHLESNAQVGKVVVSLS
jgi:NADPH:quinone reductase-like Zn-dependent oxidoreductase